MLILLGSIASAAEPIRYYQFPDGRIRLWLRGAPTVTATNSAGWQIDPAGKERDKTWLTRLKASPSPEGESPWKTLLDAIESGAGASGVYRLEPKGTISILAASGGKETVTASTSDGKQAQAEVAPDTSTDDAGLIGLLGAAGGVKTQAVTAALRHYPGVSASAKSALAGFGAAALQESGAPLILDTGNGPAVIEVKVVRPSPIVPATSTTGSSVEPTAPSRASPQPDSPLPWIPISAGAGGLAVGFIGGWLLRPRPKPAPAAPTPVRPEAPKRPTGQQPDEAWRKERDETLKALDEARAAQRRSQADADAAAARLRQIQDEATRTNQELGRQVESLQRAAQAAQVSTRTLTAKCDGYAELEQTATEAMSFLQAEIGRPETAAAVGYLLTYSRATLLQSVSIPKPTLERAMLANIERIAGQFPTSPHARKLAAEAKRLATPLGSGPISESTQPHAHARHFDEILRLLRNQRGLELSPFYFGIDDTGAAHAVYV